MPKRRRRQQHLRQAPARRKTPQAALTPEARYKPGFPMNVLTDVRVFSMLGLVVLVSFVVVGVCTQQFNRTSRPAGGAATSVPQPTADATAGPAASPAGSPAPQRTFTQAESVIEAATKAYTATIVTDKGDIVVRLHADKSPNTVNSFVFLARNKFFDGLKFHRVEAGFVAQGGDPLGTGVGGPGYETEQEPTDLTNKRGTIAMARAGGSTKFGSQFFINLKDNPGLDLDRPNQARFYPFAEVVSGMDVVDRLVAGDIMRSVTISEAPR